MNFISDFCRNNLSTKGNRLLFALATCFVIVIFLVRGNLVKYGGTYDEQGNNSRREVKSLNGDSKHLPNVENSVEKRTILKPWEQLRLPSNIRPKHYDLLIQVNLNELTFSGKSSISFHVTKSTNTIIFHTNKLTINTVLVLGSSEEKPFKIRKQFEYKKNQFFVVELAYKLKIGEYKLKLNFDGDIETKELNGFYRSTYKNNDGKTRYCHFRNKLLQMIYIYIYYIKCSAL